MPSIVSVRLDKPFSAQRKKVFRVLDKGMNTKHHRQPRTADGRFATKEQVAFSTSTDNLDPHVWDVLFPGRTSTSGAVVNVDTAQGISSLLAAHRLICNTAARCDIMVSNVVGEDKTPAYEHDAYIMLCRRPSATMPLFLFKRQLVYDASLHGNSYAYIDREALDLTIIPPDRVTPTIVYRDGYKPEITYSIKLDNGQFKGVAAIDMIHVRGTAQSGNGYIGFSLIDQARDCLGLAISHQQFASVFYSSDQVQLVVEVPQKFKDEDERQAFREQFAKVHQGNLGDKTAIVSLGTKVTSIGMSAEDTQMLNCNPHIITAMANLVGIPQSKIGGQQATSYSSIVAQNEAIFGDVYDAILTNIEQELEFKLLTEKEILSGSVAIEFDRSTLKAGDVDSEANRFINLYNAGLLTREECRAGLKYSQKAYGKFKSETNTYPTPITQGTPDAPPTDISQQPA